MRMLRFPLWKKITVMAVCLWGIIYAAPHGFDASFRAQWPAWAPSNTVPLGLDLRGGLHLLLEVDMATLKEMRIIELREAVRAILKKSRAPFKSLMIEGESIHIQGREDLPWNPEDLMQNITLDEPECAVVFLGETNLIQVSIKKEAWIHAQKHAVSQSIEILRRRIDETGTMEPTILPQGEDRIVLQLPGMTDVEHVRKLLGKTAKLTLRWVEPHWFPTKPEVAAPTGTEWLPMMDRSAGEKAEPVIAGYYATHKEHVLTGDMLKDAQALYDPNHQPEVSFQFNMVGARRFRDATTENVGRILAFVLDQEIISAPRISEPIPSGRGVIHGRFTIDEASNLALLLRSGALPAPLSIIEERSIGPDLGSDSIHQGTTATVVAILAVCLLMILVYARLGAMVSVAVLFNIILLLAGMTALQATLTLPGIAGFALTIGMAVDANVLIFERMKEEIRKKSTVPVIIEQGYAKAMVTIIDSNVTTLFGTVLLYAFGSGPIRGFAVTLTLGIVISMFTSVVVTRLLMVLWLRHKRRTFLPIGPLLKRKNIA